MDWLAKFLGWITGLLFSRPAPPSQEAIQAKAAGVAETSLKTEQVSNEAVLHAAAARDDVVRVIATDDGLRNYEATDPDNRDNR